MEDLFDSYAKTLLLDRESPEPPRPPRRKEAIAAQQDRLRTLMGEGYTVRVGPRGVTVFDLNPYGK